MAAPMVEDGIDEGASGSEQSFNNVALAGWGGPFPGSLRVSGSRVQWKKAVGEKEVEVPMEEVDNLRWLHAAGGAGILEVLRVGGEVLRFTGLRARDAQAIRDATGKNVHEYQQAVRGGTYGSVDVKDGALAFRAEDGKEHFAIPLSEVNSVDTPSKGEVNLELGDPKRKAEGGAGDQLIELSFHVPNPSREWGGGEGGDMEPYKAVEGAINEYVGAREEAEAVEAVWELTSPVTALSPRGRFTLVVYPDVLRMSGAADFRVEWTSLGRVFLLPRPSNTQQLVVLTLDKAIRKGQTRYQHIVLAFSADDTANVDLSERHSSLVSSRDKLESKYEGSEAEVFARLCRGLSGCKLTREGSFRANAGTGPAIRCSHKAEDGYMYVLEKGLFFLPKPPVLLQYDHIAHVQFQRHGGALATARMFDVSVVNSSGQEFSFANVAREEFDNLVAFLQSKRVPIHNLQEAQEQIAGAGGAGAAAAAAAGPEEEGEEGDEEEEDEDFKMDQDEEPASDDEEEDDQEGEGD